MCLDKVLNMLIYTPDPVRIHIKKKLTSSKFAVVKSSTLLDNATDISAKKTIGADIVLTV